MHIQDGNLCCLQRVHFVISLLLPGPKDVAFPQFQQNKPLDYGLLQSCRSKLGLLRVDYFNTFFFWFFCGLEVLNLKSPEVTGISYTLRYKHYQDMQEMALLGWESQWPDQSDELKYSTIMTRKHVPLRVGLYFTLCLHFTLPHFSVCSDSSPQMLLASHFIWI